MNRRNFLKIALGTIAAAIIAPKILLASVKEAPKEGIFHAPYVPVYSKTTAIQRINLRHIALKVQQSLEGYIGDFHCDATRKNVTVQTTALLEHYSRRNAIKEYRVVCDRTNNTPELVDQNSLVVDVYVKPTREVKFQQITCYIGPGRSFPIIKS